MSLPSFPNVDLFSAGIDALHGVRVARNPSHNRGGVRVFDRLGEDSSDLAAARRGKAQRQVASDRGRGMVRYE